MALMMNRDRRYRFVKGVYGCFFYPTQLNAAPRAGCIGVKGVKGYFDQIGRGILRGGLNAQRGQSTGYGRERVLIYLLTYKNTLHTLHTIHNPLWERGSSVKGLSVEPYTNGLNPTHRWEVFHFYNSLLTVKGSSAPCNGYPLPRWLNSPAGWPSSLSFGTSLTQWINSDSAPVSLSRAMKSRSSTAIKPLDPLSRPHYGMEPETYQATNARNQMPYRSERPMNERFPLIRGVAPAPTPLFRFAVCLTGGTEVPVPKFSNIFSVSPTTTPTKRRSYAR